MRKLWIRRRAVSTMIGGIIILTLFFSALTAMVLLSQQYDAYQNVGDKMSQKEVDRVSENVTALYPGLIQVTASPCALCQYNLLLSNLGGVGVQMAQIYINSTIGGTKGCTFDNPTHQGPCILTPSQTAAAFMFNINDGYVNAGEFNHTVRFWLPFTLPSQGVQGPSTPANTIWTVTTRGRVFAFEWPFSANPLAIPGFTPNIIRGDTKIAYVGSTYNSQHQATSPDCHLEGYQPAGAGLPGPGGSIPSTFYFVNPWVTTDLMRGAAKKNDHNPNIFVYALLNNTTGQTLRLASGTIILGTATSGANQKVYFIGGNYIGAIYPIAPATGIWSPNVAIIDPLNPGAAGNRNGTFLAIFMITIYDQAMQTGGNPAPSGTIFLGTAAVNNQVRDGTYTSMFFFLDGIYVRDCNWNGRTLP